MAKFYTDPTTGQRVEIQKTHKFRNFVVFPALGLLGIIIVGSAIGGGGPEAPTGQAPVVPAAPVEVAEAGPVDLAFGETHSWSGGETITVSAPTDFDTGNPYLTAPAGKRLVAVDVSVRNNGDKQFNVMGVTLSAQHNGRVAQSSWMGGDPLPNTELAPGGEVTFSQVYEVDESPGGRASYSRSRDARSSRV